MMRRLLSTVAFVALLAAPTMAHNTWGDGSAVSEGIKAKCCGDSEIHHLRPEQVHIVPGGYQIDGIPGIILEKDTQPSPDGDFWLFYGAPNAWHSDFKIRCFFAPVFGT